MAHALKPNTHYRIMTIKVAVPVDVDDSTAFDGLNEMLRPAMLAKDAIFHDYAIHEGHGMVATNGEPEEGDLFIPSLAEMPFPSTP